MGSTRGYHPAHSNCDDFQGGLFHWPKLGMALWPTWILNAATFGREITVFGLLVLLVSIAANALLYALAGLVLWVLIPKYLRPGR